MAISLKLCHMHNIYIILLYYTETVLIKLYKGITVSFSFKWSSNNFIQETTYY